VPDTPRPLTSHGGPMGLRGGGLGRSEPANLADILERVLDKGIVIAGDIRINLLDIELLTIRVRLLIASVDRAREMGIDWWERDPSLSSGQPSLTGENARLRERVAALEAAAIRQGAEDAYAEPAPMTDPAPMADPVSPTVPASPATPATPATPVPWAGIPHLGEPTPVAAANGNGGHRA
jgi:Gas vesicle protein